MALRLCASALTAMAAMVFAMFFAFLALFAVKLRWFPVSGMWPIYGARDLSALISHLTRLGIIAPRSYHQTECFAAGVQFAKAEGIIPAPEANHAVKATIDEALKCKQEGVSKTLLFNLCGHGHFDMQAYRDYMDGKLVDQEYDESEIAMALAGLPSVA